MSTQQSQFVRSSQHCLFEMLGEKYPKLSIRVFDEIDSTNNEARRMVADGFSDMCLLLADRQSGGRGRMGRSFYSPGQTGAYFSILYPVNAPLDTAVTVTAAASVAVLRAIRTLTGIEAEIKWVNDLYFGERKISGILTEALTTAEGTYVIVGIGVNLSTASFPGELANIAGSLGAPTVTAAEMAAETLCQLYPFLLDPSDRTWLGEYRSRSRVLGKVVQWSNAEGSCRGTAVEIDSEGALLVKAEDGSVTRLFSGEISVKSEQF